MRNGNTPGFGFFADIDHMGLAASIEMGKLAHAFSCVMAGEFMIRR